MTFAGDVVCRFDNAGAFRIIETVDLDSNFDDAAACQCNRCGWEGRFAELSGEASADDEPSAIGLSSNQFEQIRREISKMTGRNREIAEQLAAEVVRLNQLLDSLSRLSTGVPHDTTVG